METSLLRPRKPLFWIALSAIAGITAAEHLTLARTWLVAAFALAAGAAIVKPSRAFCLAAAALAFASLHTLRHIESPAWRVARALAESPRPVAAAGVVWSEPDTFTDRRGLPRATFWMKIGHVSDGVSLQVDDGLCLVKWAGTAPAYGDRIELKGSAQVLDAPRNPGEFDTAAWLQRHGVYFQIVTTAASDCRISGHAAGNPLRHFAITARNWISGRLSAGLPDDPEATALIRSMVLGMRGETPQDLKELFQKTGTLHLFAVSGLNVAMLATIAWYILKPLHIGRTASTLIIIPLLAAYAIVTGLSASCVRASIMASIVLIAPLLERRASPLNGIAAAALVILAWDTNQLFSPGFQLSFALVLVIMSLAHRLQRRIEILAHPDDFIPRRLWTAPQAIRVAVMRVVGGMAGVTLSAWLGSLAFMAGYFHLFSLSALVANLVAVPLAFLILALGLFSLLAGLVSVNLAVVVNHANWLCAKCLVIAVTLFAKIPGGYLYVEIRVPGRAPVCEITVLDAGEGAAMHIRTNEGDWLVDAGHARDYERTLLPYLRSRGVNRLDGFILTHGDSAHAGGAVPLMRDFEPRWVADSAPLDRSPTRRAFHAELAANRIGRRFFVQGDRIALGSHAMLHVLHPPAGIERSLADDKALILSLEAGTRRILLTSDNGFFAEERLRASGQSLNADVLIKGWHDRDLSGTPDFISSVQPQVLVCSAPAFGLIPEQFDKWAAPIAARGIKILSQARCGAVRISIFDDGELYVQTWRPQ